MNKTKVTSEAIWVTDQPITCHGPARASEAQVGASDPGQLVLFPSCISSCTEARPALQGASSPPTLYFSLMNNTSRWSLPSTTFSSCRSITSGLAQEVLLQASCFSSGGGLEEELFYSRLLDYWWQVRPERVISG